MIRKWTILASSLVAAGILGLWSQQVQGSDHADTPDIAANPGTDLTDVFMFPSPDNAENVVMVMTVHPLITAADTGTVSFDPNVLYQFKMDNTGDSVEDLVIQAKFSGTGASQRVAISGPVKPASTGTVSSQMTPYAVTGLIGESFSPTAGMQVFCGVREDPFFFDLEQFFKILPDRATPLTGVPVPDPNNPKDLSWRPVGQAKDFLSENKFNVLAIVVELPRSMLQQGENN